MERSMKVAFDDHFLKILVSGCLWIQQSLNDFPENRYAASEVRNPDLQSCFKPMVLIPINHHFRTASILLTRQLFFLLWQEGKPLPHLDNGKENSIWWTGPRHNQGITMEYIDWHAKTKTTCEKSPGSYNKLVLWYSLHDDNAETFLAKVIVTKKNTLEDNNKWNI